MNDTGTELALTTSTLGDVSVALLTKDEKLTLTIGDEEVIATVKAGAIKGKTTITLTIDNGKVKKDNIITAIKELTKTNEEDEADQKITFKITAGAVTQAEKSIS